MSNDPANEFLSRCEAHLGPCALRAADSEGRATQEAPHPYRTCYQRDRDRILHCSAFRRLDSKTQVFVPHEQDHRRTRLTHTLEVAQVARTLSRALAANEDVAEAVALAHDLGHPPFGHAGESVLNELMSEAGGFEHNRQSLRVVDYLEHPYGNFRGLNLTNAVRRCLAKHQTRYDAPQAGEFDDRPQIPLEGQLVDLADEIAYTSADAYDALSAGWITTDELGPFEMWAQAAGRAEKAMPDAKPIHKRIQACRELLAMLTDDVLTETAGRIEQMQLTSPADVQQSLRRCAAFSGELVKLLRPLQEFLLERVYRHLISLEHDEHARRTITGLFSAYLAKPELLPERYRQRIEDQGAHRVICDYIAGMTDTYAHREYDRLEEPGTGQ